MDKILHSCWFGGSESVLFLQIKNKALQLLPGGLGCWAALIPLSEESWSDNEIGMGPSGPSHRKLSYRKCSSEGATGLRMTGIQAKPPCDDDAWDLCNIF